MPGPDLSRRDWIATLLAGALGARVAAADPDDDPLTRLTAIELLDRLGRGALTPSQVTDAYLARIARRDPVVHAFITVTADRARRQAAAPARGLLAGLPLAHKDLFETAGVLTTAGSRLYRNYVPARDAAIVAALSRAGAITVGKTNTHELGGGVTTINPYYGPTRNPADPARIPGGSSGGSAAAVAGRLAAAATGSDTGGSVRIPAALCGCVGFKPSFGRLSTNGLIGACPTFDHVGLLTRTVADAAMLFRVLVGAPARGAVAEPRSRIRVGVARPYFFDRLQPDVDAAMASAVARFRDQGARVVDQPLPVDGGTFDRVFAPIVAEEIWSRYGAAWKSRPQDFSTDFAAAFVHPPPSLAAIGRARRARALFQQDVTRVFDEVDVVLTPTVPITAPRLTDPIDAGLILRNTWPFNAARTPAISIPCGVDRDGLPIGLHLAAAPGQDDALLAAALAVEDLKSL